MKSKFQVELDQELETTIARHLAETNIPTKREYLATLVAVADYILDAAKENQTIAFVSEDKKEFQRFIIPSFDAVRRKAAAASRAA